MTADAGMATSADLARRLDRVERLAADSPILVRVGESRDWPEIAALVRRAFDESNDYGFELQDAKVKDMGRRCADPSLSDLGLVAVNRDSGRVVGFLYATAAEHMFAPVIVAVCQVIYVVPEMRWSAAPFALLRSFVKRAATGGAAMASVHVTSGIRVRESHRFLTKLYFTHVGGNYLLPLRRPAPADTQSPED